MNITHYNVLVYTIKITLSLLCTPKPVYFCLPVDRSIKTVHAKLDCTRRQGLQKLICF